jgi:hypothetical protein
VVKKPKAPSRLFASQTVSEASIAAAQCSEGRQFHAGSDPWTSERIQVPTSYGGGGRTGRSKATGKTRKATEQVAIISR